MEEGAKPLEESSGAIESLSIKELKAFLEERGVSYADCFEKSELIARAKESQHIPTKKQPKQHEGENLSVSALNLTHPPFSKPDAWATTIQQALWPTGLHYCRKFSHT